VVITDRGEAVAELAPPGGRAPASSYPPALQALARRGLATLGQPNRSNLYPKRPAALAPGRAARLLAQERGDR
jgi:antitoxin (DNA-binding transcriptional repressor) of toxin-antitoxin stability system